MKNLKLRNLILTGYATLIALSVVVAVLVFVNASAVAQRYEQVERANLNFRDTGTLRLGESAMQRAMRGYLLHRDEAIKRAYLDGEKRYDEAYLAMKVRVKDPGQQALLEQIAEMQKLLREDSKRLMALVDAGKQAQAIEEFKAGREVELFEKLKAAAVEFMQREDEIVKARQEEMNASLRMLTSVTMVGALGSVLVAVVGALWMVRRVTAALGDAANAVVSATTQIAATIEEHERVATQQSAAVNQTTATMDELGTSSRQSADQAEVVAAVAKQASSLSEDGSASVGEAIEGMRNLKQKVDAIAGQILSLSEQASQIGTIANLVSELAGETNMLALNAAVEAARAGESGRGFAVVASEVRKLAEQSKKSAERANALVSEIQKATNSAVMVTEEGTNTVEKVLDMAKKAGNSFSAIATATTSVFENVQQVMLNSKQQATAVNQVVEAMNSLRAGAKQTADGIAQTRSGVQQINAAAQRVNAII